MKTKHVRSRKSASITNPRWAAYATAGAATALVGVSSAEADIHYSGLLNQVFDAPTSSVTYGTFALDHAAVIRFAHNRATSSQASLGIAFFRIEGASLSNMFVGIGAGNARYPSNLSSGLNVSTAGPFTAHSGNFFASLAFHNGAANTQWLDSGTGFIGFRFDGGSGIEYGWARVTMDDGPENTFTLVDFAWADPGESIATGQVPEPGSLGLLAIGAAGLLLWRKRRSQVAAQK